MNDWISSIGILNWLSADQLMALARAVITLVGGLLLARIIGSSVARLMSKHATLQATVLTRRLVFYFLAVLAITTSLHQLGFKLGVLLGAAGVLTVAVGFASQTSASNLISGLFLIAERPFSIGDVIRVSDITGEVLSIDLLSVKLRTFDNLFVRVPNEDLIKSRITNLTHFPVRRNDLQLSVNYKEDLKKVKDILFDLAARNPICLNEPQPLFILRKFGESGVEFQFSVWALRDNYLALNNAIQEEIKIAFEKHGIEIPYPHRSLVAGSVTSPFPTRIVAEDDGGAAAGRPEPTSRTEA